MRSFDELLAQSSATHGHSCAGQVLGVRLAMAGCRAIGIDEPRGCKKLLVYVEIDRCATDAVQAVTGCSLGKRTLKFLDYGKMAATFVNTETQKAVRVLARDDARAHAASYAPDATTPKEAQKQAYRIMPEEMLFTINPATLDIPTQEMPGYRGQRVPCAACGEGINFHREVRRNGSLLCIPCAQGGLLPKGNGIEKAQSAPNVLLVVGYKKVGKTTLIERLIPELSRRGYLVGTVKRHHSELSIEVDKVGSDSWRHRQAGAASVTLATPTGWAIFRDAPRTASLNQVLASVGPADIVLVEGFHEEPQLKIEVISEAEKRPLCDSDPNLVALVTPNGHKSAVPIFAPESIKSIADLIERKLLGAKDGERLKLQLARPVRQTPTPRSDVEP